MSYKKMSYGHVLSDKIEEGEIFPVGGNFVGAIDNYMTVDFDRFQAFFQKVAKNAEKLRICQPLKDWYLNLKKDLDYDLFCHMYAFNLMIQPDFANATQNEDKRRELYDKTGKQKLSESIKGRLGACTEFSVLAKGYFQSQGIPVRYVGGELVANRADFDSFETHSFIVFQNNGKDYVYDPVNPLTRQVPRIAEFVGKRDNFYIESRCLFNTEGWFYSGGDQGEFLQNLSSVKRLTQVFKKRSEQTSMNFKH